MRQPRTPPDHRTQLAARAAQGVLVTVTSPTLPDGRYVHWDDLRYREPPEGLTAEDWWAGLKQRREGAATPLRAMQAAFGQPFHLVELEAVRRRLHEFDRVNVGREFLTALGNHDAETEYRVRQLIEEAISSSAIEGARPATRDLARQMVREARPPTSKDERMILNNFRAMTRLLELVQEGVDLTLDHLLELHRVLGEDALDRPGMEGTLRGPEHQVTVSDLVGNVWHVPPPAEGLRARLTHLLAFVNGADDAGWLHPVLRAILSHFWLAYEHPFRDGNGRMARALFYWCMLKSGYEFAEFLSISGPIDRSPKKYYMAFAHVESDGLDLTYFVLHQLDVMQQALDELLVHLRSRAERTRALAGLVRDFDQLNHRQRALLQHAIQHPFASYTIEGHALSHRVHYQTARTDLAKLTELGLLQDKRVEKGKRFSPSASFAAQIRTFGGVAQG